ncbi:MAG: haloacid dehalogenase [Chloroflexota bacterium]|nr:haloacid dehalogenase [Chloroflexota bacterium]
MPADPQPMAQTAAEAVERLAAKHQAREMALKASRDIIRLSANAIRAVHRHEMDDAQRLIAEAAAQAAALRESRADHPDLYFTGYAQDAQKEYAEACAAYAFIAQTALPAPGDIGVEDAPYLNGLAEAASELRRYILDSLRRDDDARCEELMERMDEVYTLMVGVDFPDAVTGGLRRTTDQLRAVLERTRGDLTMTMRQRRLERLLREGGGA